MNKTALTFLIGGVVVLFLMVAALAVFIGLPLLMREMGAEPQGPVLVYEVAPESLSVGQKVDIEKLIQAIDRRLNPDWSRLARVRKIDDQRIEIALISKEPANRQRVERLLAASGMLEFRILANNRDNKALIERALAEPSKTKLIDAAGKLEAWWVPVRAQEVASLNGSGKSDIALRKQTKGNEEITEVLLVPDDYNVTGAYLSNVGVNTDNRGQPCVNFHFNKAGSQLFGRLTGTHLPDDVNHSTYKLGIVLDGVLYSAPAIQSTIYDSGEITGSFKKEQVEDMARVLNAGSLPAKIRPVEKQSP
jgi:SecD/SecF fusion protein